MSQCRPSHVTRAARWRVFAPPLAFLLLTACVDSVVPLLGDAKPLLGERLRLQTYTLREGSARDADTASFRWDGTRYVGRIGRKERAAFTVHELEGRDLIVQTVPLRKDVPVEYTIARKLADGVYLTAAIDENDADEATRAQFCIKDSGRSCRIATREALTVFARASAAKLRDTGALAIILAR